MHLFTVDHLTLRGQAKAEAISATGQFKQSPSSFRLIYICISVACTVFARSE